MIGASTVETLVAVKNALDGAPVYIHLDLDVIDPEEFPRPVPAPGGLAAGEALRPARAVAEDCELVGMEVTAFEAPGRPEGERDAAAATVDARARSRCSTDLERRSVRVGSSTSYFWLDGHHRPRSRRHLVARPPLRSLVDDLHERRERARLGGGEEKIARQHGRTSSPRASGSRC